MRSLSAQSCASTLAATVIVTLVATLIEQPKIVIAQIVVSGAAARNSQRQQEAQETSANLMQMFNALSRQQQQIIIRQMTTSVASANGSLITPQTATVSQSTTPASPEVRVATAPVKFTTRAARTFLRATKSAPAPQVRPPQVLQTFGKTSRVVVVTPPAPALQIFEAPKVVAAVKTVTKTAPLRAQPPSPSPPPPLSQPPPAEPEVRQQPPLSKITSLKRVTQTVTVVRPALKPQPTPAPASNPAPTSEVPPPVPRILKTPVAKKVTPPPSPPSIVELPEQQRIEDLASIEQQESGGNTGVSFEDTGGELLAGGQLNSAGVSFGSLQGTVSGGYNGAPAPSSTQTPTPPKRVKNQLFEAQDAQQQQPQQRQQSLSRFEDLANWTAASINNKWYFMRPVDNPQELGLTSLAAAQVAGASEQVAVIVQLKTIPMTALLATNSVEPEPASTTTATNTTANNNNNRATRATELVITAKPSTSAASFKPTATSLASQDVGSTNYDVTTASDGDSNDDDDDAETRRAAVNDWRRRR